MGDNAPERLRGTLRFSPLIVLAVLSLWLGLALAFLVAELSKSGGGGVHLGRKVFHIAIFSGAVPAQMVLGFWGVVTYGSSLSILLLGMYWNRRDSGPFDPRSQPALEKVPRRIVSKPYFSTVLGGLLGVLLVGQFAIVGYLVCGWGDAAGELVGRRWGQHPFAPPFGEKGLDTRTIEGSAGVFLLGSCGAFVAILLLDFPFTQALSVGLLCGGAGTVVEAFSGQNTDNLWMQIVPALTAWWVFL